MRKGGGVNVEDVEALLNKNIKGIEVLKEDLENFNIKVCYKRNKEMSKKIETMESASK